MEFDNRPYYIRLKPFVREYLNEHKFSSLSEFIDNSVKANRELEKQNKRSNYFKDMSNNVVMLGIGAIFIVFSLLINSLVAEVLLFLLGVFFMSASLVSIMQEVLGKIGRASKNT